MENPQERQARGDARRRGRRPLPWEPETIGYRLPPGTLLLTQAITLVFRRINGQAVTDGIILSEAMITLARLIKKHPGFSEGERLIVNEYADRLKQSLWSLYSESGGTAWVPARPSGSIKQTIAELQRTGRWPREGQSEARFRRRESIRLDKPWGSDDEEKISNSVPFGFTKLMREVKDAYDRRNLDPLVAEGMILGEAVVAFAMVLRHHPHVRDQERSLLDLYRQDLERRLDGLYRQNELAGTVFDGRTAPL